MTGITLEVHSDKKETKRRQTDRQTEAPQLTRARDAAGKTQLKAADFLTWKIAVHHNESLVTSVYRWSIRRSRGWTVKLMLDRRLPGIFHLPADQPTWQSSIKPNLKKLFLIDIDLIANGRLLSEGPSGILTSSSRPSKPHKVGITWVKTITMDGVLAYG